MRAWKSIVAGVIVGGAGVATRWIGSLIVGATGASTGPFLNYGMLMDVAGMVLEGVAAVLVAYGVLRSVYTALSSDGEGSDATNSRSQSAPSSQQDRPRNRRRS